MHDSLQESLDKVLAHLRKLNAPYVPKANAYGLDSIKETIEGTLKHTFPDRKFVVEVEPGEDGHSVSARISPCLEYVVVEVIVK